MEPVSNVNIIPPPLIPDEHKVRKAEEEQKFAHQMEYLMVKEQKEGDKAKKVEEGMPDIDEKNKKKNKKNLSDNSQNFSEDEQKGEEKDEKGKLIDINA